MNVKLELHISNLLQKYYFETNEENLNDLHTRIDEVFLLTSKIYGITFQKVCEKYITHYLPFSERDFKEVKNNIRNSHFMHNIIVLAEATY